MTEQKTGRSSHIEPDLTDLPSGALNPLLPTVRLQCLDADSAKRVVAEFPNRDRGGRSNTMKADGSGVVITYADKMWPFDIADWAGENELASDSAAARVIACL